MNKLVKDALVLTCITVIAGFALGLVYEITKAPIANVNTTCSPSSTSWPPMRPSPTRASRQKTPTSTMWVCF